MLIGLHDTDSHNFPNLALMKLSSWHKTKGDKVEWFSPMRKNKYDRIYSSKVFTWSPVDPFLPKDERVILGGTGYHSTETLSFEVEHSYPDYSLYGVDTAYGFVTRGCPNKCPWCIVPSKEGDIRANADVGEFWNGQKNIILMDNNILAHKHGLHQLEKISAMPVNLDCNQGLDARLVGPTEAKVLAAIKWKRLRFACDRASQMAAVETAVNRIRSAAGKKTFGDRIFVYVLVKDIQDALERVEFLRHLECDPFAQPYRDFENISNPTQEQKAFARWVNRKHLFRSCSWGEYKDRTINRDHQGFLPGVA